MEYISAREDRAMGLDRPDDQLLLCKRAQARSEE